MLACVRDAVTTIGRASIGASRYVVRRASRVTSVYWSSRISHFARAAPCFVRLDSAMAKRERPRNDERRTKVVRSRTQFVFPPRSLATPRTIATRCTIVPRGVDSRRRGPRRDVSAPVARSSRAYDHSRSPTWDGAQNGSVAVA